MKNTIAGQVIFMQMKDWVLLGLITVSLVIWRFASRRVRITGKKAGPAHAKAIQFLKDQDYEILKIKPALTMRMAVDESTHTYEMTADYLVAKGGRRYIVRVIRGSKPVRLQSKMWRGSLLRDVLAFEAAGILVLNLEKGILQDVRFRI